MNLLPHRLRTRRKALGLTQHELAKRCGMDQGHLSRAENGTSSVSIELLHSLARELKISIDELVGAQTGEAADDDAAQELSTGKGTAPGLRELAADEALVQALRITPEELRMLASVELPRRVTKDGYLQLLVTLRGIGGG